MSKSKILKKKSNVKPTSPDFGYTNIVYRVEKQGKKFLLINAAGEVVERPKDMRSWSPKGAYESGTAIRKHINVKGRVSYRKVDIEEYNMLVSPLPETGVVTIEEPTSHDAVLNVIHKESLALKPKELIVKDLKWKYLVRSAVRGKNIMMTGPSGTGKTMAARQLVKQLQRPDYYFNFGSSQDPRATLIGNTGFRKETGTFFGESAFVKAIKTENAIILLDEISRAHPDAWNILMTVLDEGQRYLRLDEAEGSPIVKVAKGVTFIATANIGNEYTATRVMDRAILDRFVTIEMEVLNAEEEFGLLKMMFPKVDEENLKAVAEIASHTREVSRGEVGKLSNMISTRVAVETASLLYDGFSLLESAEVAILPFFSQDGGLESERTYVKQLVQKYVKTTDEKLFTAPSDESDVKVDESQQITW